MLKAASSATDTSKYIEILHRASFQIANNEGVDQMVYAFVDRIQKVRFSRVEAQLEV